MRLPILLVSLIPPQNGWKTSRDRDAKTMKNDGLRQGRRRIWPIFGSFFQNFVKVLDIVHRCVLIVLTTIFFSIKARTTHIQVQMCFLNKCV